MAVSWISARWWACNLPRSAAFAFSSSFQPHALPKTRDSILQISRDRAPSLAVQLSPPPSPVFHRISSTLACDRRSVHLVSRPVLGGYALGVALPAFFVDVVDPRDRVWPALAQFVMPPRRSHKKSRAGCRRCKNRKIKVRFLLKIAGCQLPEARQR